MLARLRERIAAEDKALHGHAPQCPDRGRPPAARGRKATSFLTRFGTVRAALQPSDAYLDIPGRDPRA